jgi:hypothetical protein
MPRRKIIRPMPLLPEVICPKTCHQHSSNAADKPLIAVNNAMLNTPLKKHIFFGARFSITDNLVLTTVLHSSNEGLKEYLDAIENAVKYIGPATARFSTLWLKFLLHGVPTHGA